jgi:hypothetical protein
MALVKRLGLELGFLGAIRNSMNASYVERGLMILLPLVG